MPFRDRLYPSGHSVLCHPVQMSEFGKNLSVVQSFFLIFFFQIQPVLLVSHLASFHYTWSE
jgi:hypothetical protein